MDPQILDLLNHLPPVHQAWGFLIPIALSIAGAIAKNKQKNRETENAQTNTSNDRLMDQYRQQQQALVQLLGLQSGEQSRHADIDLDRKKFSLDAPGTRGKQALLGSLMQNLQPAKFTGLDPRIMARMGNVQGGLSPSAIGPLARQMGAEMQQNALKGQRAGDNFMPLERTNFQGGLLPAPELGGFKGPGKAESILGLLGAGGQAYGAYQAGQFGGGGGGYQMNNQLGQVAPTYANWRIPTDTFGNNG